MKVSSYVFTAMLIGAMIAGCAQQEQKESSSRERTQPAAAADTHSHADGSSHAGHDQGDAAHSHGHSHGGEVVALGEKRVLGFTVKAMREGAVAAGKEAVFLVETVPAAEAVRLWVGDEQATNSVRSKAEGGPTRFHAHARVPALLTDDANLWVEVQNENSERGAVAFGLSGTSGGSHSHGTETHAHDGEAEEDHSHDDHSDDHSHDHGDEGHSH